MAIIVPRLERSQGEYSIESTHLLSSANSQFSAFGVSGCSKFRLSKVFLLLFLLGCLAILALGAGLGIHNLLSSHPAHVHDAIATSGLPNKSAFGTYRYAAVAADAAQCATIGTDVLAMYGSMASAVDAAIASLLCLGIHNAHSAGIGGGFFMLIYNKTDEFSHDNVFALDAREVAPQAAHRDMYANGDSSSSGGKAVAVPGEIRGYHEAWQKFGKLPWKTLFHPSIRLCREGFLLGKAQADAVASMADDVLEDPLWREIFIKADGSMVTEGDTVINNRLADSLARIAEDPESYYTGSLAEDIVADIQDSDGLVTLEDLATYKPLWKKAPVAPLQSMSWHMYAMPPPSSGVMYQFMVRLLEGYNLTAHDIRYVPGAETTYQRIAETFKFGFAQRHSLGDEDFVDMEPLLKDLNSKAYIDGIRSRIDDAETHEVPYYLPKAVSSLDGGTCHLSVLAQDGSAVSVTTTINTKFGSKVRGSRTGIIYNNEMDDFDKPGPADSDGLLPAAANFIEAGKRPASSMVPTLMLDKHGHVRLIVGSSGGKNILSGTTYVTAHHLWLGKRIDEALDVARLHHQLSPNVLEYEQGFPRGVISGLEYKGHMTEQKGTGSVTQAIRSYCCEDAPICDVIDVERHACIQATSDRRKGGAPDGF